MALFEAQNVDGFFTIFFPEQIKSEHVAALEAEMKSWLANPAEVHIFNFASTKNINNSAYRAFLLYSRTLKQLKKQLFTINVSENLNYLINKEGMVSIFNIQKSLDDVKRKFTLGKKPPTVRVEIINPFLTATQNVLGTQAGLSVKFDKPFLANGGLPVVDLVGMVQVNCNEFKGSIALCFPGSTFLAVYEKMVGEKHETINPGIEDGAAEILNMIFGQVKTELNQKGYHLHMAIPTVLVGEKLRLSYQSQGTTMVLPFESSVGPFRIEIVVVDNE